MRLLHLFFAGLIIVLSSCSQEKVEINRPDGRLSILPEMTIPEDNPMTQASIALGKKLFYDPRLSDDGMVSCASCHAQEFGFAQNQPLAFGSEGIQGRRNSPSLTNVGYQPHFTFEGGVSTLEMQVLVPIQEHDEFNSNILEIVDRLSDDEIYDNLSLEAYDRSVDPFVITRAIAAFERSMVSESSRYDLKELGLAEFTDEEELGESLFYSEELKCSQCHSGVLFTNFNFENNGLYQNYPDSGRFRLTNNQEDIGLFKIPTLRNIEVTGPYMHDGTFETLEDVILHYAQGGSNHFNQSNLVQGFNIDETEVNALKAFLMTLTDDQFLTNPTFQP
ncbi:MAG: cytochrome-c peroxidase [Flavobacteriales bacterium]|nr:cytochrome-c peroxidase [Flavobacteriales bacterium]